MKSAKFTAAEADQVEIGIKSRRIQEDEILAMGWQTELDLLNRMMAWTFHESRVPRSAEYREGVRDIMLFKLVEKSLRNPFVLGTASADAWWAGVEVGKQVLKFHLTKGTYL
jgi:hypothetical protein